jgi:hypothetical protein
MFSHQSSLIIIIKRIQNRLLRVLAYKTKQNSYIEQPAVNFNIESLENRSKYNMLWFYKL